MPKRVRALLVLVVVSAIVAYWVYVFYQQRLSQENPYIQASGSIEATEIDVSSQVPGKVLRVYATEGDVVRKGRKLVVLDDTILRDQVAQAKAGVSIAQTNYHDAVDNDSDAEQDVALAQLEQARLALSMARVQRSYATITAPTTGTVLSRAIEAGEVVSPGNTLIALSDLRTVNLTIYVPEPNLGEVRIGAEAFVSVDAFPGRRFRGHVSSVATEPEFTPVNVETKEQRVKTVFAVAINLPNRLGVLKPGMPADASIKKVRL